MKHAAPFFAAALLCSMVVAADKAPAPKTTTIEKILESVASKDKGPKGEAWTEVQANRYADALKSKLEDQALKMPVGKIKDVKEIKGVTYAICSLKDVMAGGVVINDLETKIALPADEAANIKVGQAATVSGISINPTVKASKLVSNDLHVVVLKLEFKDAKLTLK
ncbi:MAG: hypothetical protein QM754_18580 [Tepidisphaeraceae bacterium]